MKWSGKWIWDGAAENVVNSYCLFRHSFRITRFQKATLRICADSHYHLWINGRYVGNGPVRSDPRHQLYDVRDIGKYLVKGNNCIAAVACHIGIPNYSYMPGKAGFLLQCEMLLPNGRRQTISTNDKWKAWLCGAWNPDALRISRQSGFCEIVDLSKLPSDWQKIVFDDSDWNNATVIAKAADPPWTSLKPREIPFPFQKSIYAASVIDAGSFYPEIAPDNELDIAALVQNSRLEPNSDLAMALHHALPGKPDIHDLLVSRLLQTKGDTLAKGKPASASSPVVLESNSDAGGTYFTLDFGREVVGYPEFDLTAPQGAVIDLGYSELLVDGRVVSNRHKVKCADRVITREGRQKWCAFDWRAFRFVQINIRSESGPVRLHSIGCRFTSYPVKYVPPPKVSPSGNIPFEEIWKTSAYTVQLNMQDLYMDCPWRERVQWWGDARIEGLIAMYAFGDTKLLRQGIRQIAQSQRPDGMTQCFYPGVYDNAIPGFCLIWILSIHDYYQWTGDKKLIAELYPSIKKALGWFYDLQEPDGLIGGPIHYWNFWDWADLDLTGPSLLINAFFAGALDAAIQMARTLGYDDDAKAFATNRERVIKACRSRLWDEKQGLFADCVSHDGELSRTLSQQTNSAAVLFDIAPPGQVDSILDAIHSCRKDIVQAGSPYFSFYVLQALWKTGRGKQALEYIQKRWGYMIQQGATTCWEQWNDDNSLCHGWSGGPAYDFGRHVIGVSPEEPGFSTALIAPVISGLKKAEGAVRIPSGQIVVAWEASSTGFKLHFEAPKKLHAIVKLPESVMGQLESISVNGKLLRDFEHWMKKGKGKIVFRRGGANTIRVLYR